MKNIVTILLIFSLNSTFAQNINYALIDTLCKRSDFVSVIELIEIDHVHGISLDLFNEISYIKYKIINTYNHKNNNHLSSQQKNIKIVDEFQFIHRCETEEGDTCTFRQFKIGDTCIIFLKLKDTLSNTVELTCHGNSPMHLAKISSLYKKSFLLYSYLKSVYWTTNKEKIINSKEIVGKKNIKLVRGLLNQVFY